MTRGSAWIFVVLAGCGAGAMGPEGAAGDGAIGTVDGGAGGPGADGGGGGPGRDATFGDPGCGLGAAAFCDTFDVGHPGGRAGDLDEASWAVSRFSPAGPTSDGKVFRIAPATVLPRRDGVALEPCRGDVPARVSPPDDTLICDAGAAIGSPHLLAAVAAQNYGENAYRVRRPFDFAARTGTIVFDADVYSPNALLGWVSLDVTADPTPTPGFAQRDNFEGSAVPRDGFSLQLIDTATCARVGLLTTAVDHAERFVDAPRGDVCAATAWGHLNRFRVTVSRTRIEVYATPASPDGVTFGDELLVNTFDVDLPFERGYVNLVVHNHASLKYWADFGAGFGEVDAWVARFDNVGFDGPIVDDARELDVPLPRAATADGIDTGWLAPDRAGGATARLTIPGVTVGAATRARIALTSWYCMPCEGEASDFVLHYRVNGGAWRDRVFSAGEQAALGSGSGGLGHMLEVDVAALRDGDNVVEFATSGVPQNYPPGVLDLTLVLD